MQGQQVFNVRVDRRTARLPERLGQQWRTLLVCGDAAVTLFVALVVLSGDGSHVAAAILTAAVVCGSFWLCGMYKHSYAVTERDEAYYACTGVLFATIPAIVFLAVVGNFAVVSILLALLFTAVGTSALRIRLHIERRTSVPEGGVSSITPRAWHARESGSFRMTKRAFDLAIAAVAAVVFLPVMLIAAIAITLESGAPVLFRQERVGENGRPFWILKFRTMRPNAGGQWVKPGDNRITKVGGFLRRTSLDELPQLFNVLRGEMSVVGPRPEMLTFATSFSRTIPNYDQRHVVAPGITGWAQVYLKRNLDPSDIPNVLPYDLFYVEHSSIVLDCAIVLKTAAEIVFHRAV